MRPFAPLARSARALHTSAVRADARQVTSDFLTRLQMPTGAAGSSKSANAHAAARGMIGSVGMRDQTIDDGRKMFRDGKITPPHAYEDASLYAEPKRSPRAPLLGPTNKVAKRIDPFYIRGSNPVDHAMNPLMSYRFINNLGKLKGRAETGLTWRSQRLVGKMVRRARAMGVIPRWDNRPRPGGLGDNDFTR